MRTVSDSALRIPNSAFPCLGGTTGPVHLHRRRSQDAEAWQRSAWQRDDIGGHVKHESLHMPFMRHETRERDAVSSRVRRLPDEGPHCWKLRFNSVDQGDMRQPSSSAMARLIAEAAELAPCRDASRVYSWWRHLPWLCDRNLNGTVLSRSLAVCRRLPGMNHEPSRLSARRNLPFSASFPNSVSSLRNSKQSFADKCVPKQSLGTRKKNVSITRR